MPRVCLGLMPARQKDGDALRWEAPAGPALGAAAGERWQHHGVGVSLPMVGGAVGRGMGAAPLPWWGQALGGGCACRPCLGLVCAQLTGMPPSPQCLSGFVVGHAGLYQALAMFAVAYFIIGMTVLSVCAIATNGALDAGGAYCILCCGCCCCRARGPKSGDCPVASGCHAGAGTPLAWEEGLGSPNGGLRW